jgi:hypothetical protein
MIRIPVLCPRCYTDQVVKGGKTTVHPATRPREAYGRAGRAEDGGAPLWRAR